MYNDIDRRVQLKISNHIYIYSITSLFLTTSDLIESRLLSRKDDVFGTLCGMADMEVQKFPTRVSDVTEAAQTAASCCSAAVPLHMAGRLCRPQTRGPASSLLQSTAAGGADCRVTPPAAHHGTRVESIDCMHVLQLVLWSTARRYSALQ